MKRGYLLFSTLLSIAAVIFSCIAISRTLHEYLQVSALSLIVGVLAVMVTVLLGWQIFVLIDMKNYNEKFNHLVKDVEHEILITKGYANLGYAHTNIAWLTPAKREDWFIEYVRHSLLALSQFSKAGEYKTCWAIIDDLLTQIEGGDCAFYDKMKNLKQEWLRSLVEVEHVEKIDNYNKLLHTISLF